MPIYIWVYFDSVPLQNRSCTRNLPRRNTFVRSESIWQLGHLHVCAGIAASIQPKAFNCPRKMHRVIWRYITDYLVSNWQVLSVAKIDWSRNGVCRREGSGSSGSCLGRTCYSSDLKFARETDIGFSTESSADISFWVHSVLFTYHSLFQRCFDTLWADRPHCCLPPAVSLPLKRSLQHKRWWRVADLMGRSLPTMETWSSRLAFPKVWEDPASTPTPNSCLQLVTQVTIY